MEARTVLTMILAREKPKRVMILGVQVQHPVILSNSFSKNYIHIMKSMYIYYLICIFLVNGQLGNWNDWEDCSVTCGGGIRNRARSCDNPKPAFGGNNCSYDSLLASETKRCNENACLGKANAFCRLGR